MNPSPSSNTVIAGKWWCMHQGRWSPTATGWFIERDTIFFYPIRKLQKFIELNSSPINVEKLGSPFLGLGFIPKRHPPRISKQPKMDFNFHGAGGLIPSLEAEEIIRKLWKKKLKKVQKKKCFEVFRDYPNLRMKRGGIWWVSCSFTLSVDKPG